MKQDKEIQFHRNSPIIINKKKLNKIQQFFFYLDTRTINLLLYSFFFTLFFLPLVIFLNIFQVNTFTLILIGILFSIYTFFVSVLINEKLFITNLYRYRPKTNKQLCDFYTESLYKNIEKSYIVNHHNFTNFIDISHALHIMIETFGEPLFDELKRNFINNERNMLFVIESPTLIEVKEYIQGCRKRGNKIFFYKPFSFKNFSLKEKKEIYSLLIGKKNMNSFVKKTIESLNDKEILRELDKYLIENLDEDIFHIWRLK